jgi:signal transduction histidine kinase
MQEAVNNSLKYAATDRVDVFLGKEHDRYVLQISDHGKGFEIAQIEMGNGLNNMKKRARDIDAEIAIISKVGEGTDITVRWG